MVYIRQWRVQGRGLGLNPLSLSLIFHNFITCVKGINCFRILFACSFVDLMQIPKNEFACKLRNTVNGPKTTVLSRFWWESGLSFASRKHFNTFCRPFLHHAWLRLCSAAVHFIRNNCLYFVCYG